MIINKMAVLLQHTKNYFIITNFAFQSHQLQIIIALGDIYFARQFQQISLGRGSFSQRWVESGNFS